LVLQDGVTRRMIRSGQTWVVPGYVAESDGVGRSQERPQPTTQLRGRGAAQRVQPHFTAKGLVG
jgi:hypothetical protein